MKSRCAPSCPPRRAFVACDATPPWTTLHLFNLPEFHLSIGEFCSDKPSHFFSTPSKRASLLLSTFKIERMAHPGVCAIASCPAGLRPDFFALQGAPKSGSADLRDVRVWAVMFVHLYNLEHRHSSIRCATEAQCHSGQVVAKLKRLYELYQQACQCHPAGSARHTKDVPAGCGRHISTPATRENSPGLVLLQIKGEVFALAVITVQWSATSSQRYFSRECCVQVNNAQNRQTVMKQV